MDLRTHLLRLMLMSLAAAAVLGALAVMVTGGSILWRVNGTALTMAAAAGLSWRVSLLIDKRKTRAAGLLGMGAVIVEFLLIVGQIWELRGTAFSVPVTYTVLCIAPTTLAAMTLLRLRYQAATSAAATGGLWITGVVFLIMMLAAWGDLGYPAEERLWQTSLALALFGGLAVLAEIRTGPAAWRFGRRIGVAAACVACLMMLADIYHLPSSPVGVVIFTLATALACVAPHANLALLCPLQAAQEWVRTATVAGGVLTAATISAVVIMEQYFHLGSDSTEWVGRVAAASGILTGCGSMALVVLVRMNRRTDLDTVGGEFITITMICPRCRKKQRLPSGDAQCLTCGLRISINVEEPRCPCCEYLLYNLTSERCPECGTPLPGRGLELADEAG